jgi:hypothetical protein
VDLYIHSPRRLHGVVLNWLSTGTTLPFLPLPQHKKIHYHVHKSLPMAAILSPIKPINVLTLFFKIHFNVTLPCTHRCSKWCLLFRLLISPMRATCYLMTLSRELPIGYTRKVNSYSEHIQEHSSVTKFASMGVTWKLSVMLSDSRPDLPFGLIAVSMRDK